MPTSRVSVKFFVKICFRLYERRASPHWRDLTIDYPRSRLGGLEILHINALKRAGPPRRASKSKLRTHDKGCLDQHFFLITFHFTSSVCLCVGYKMKACTQISDSGFRRKINVVSPGRRASFSPCKREVKSSPLGRAGPTPCKHPPYTVTVLVA